MFRLVTGRLQLGYCTVLYCTLALALALAFVHGQKADGHCQTVVLPPASEAAGGGGGGGGGDTKSRALAKVAGLTFP